jgi:alpha-tubulin suppressor-like RCC1 family protein
VTPILDLEVQGRSFASPVRVLLHLAGVALLLTACGGSDECVPEACNGMDDDCDGSADEGFDLSSDPEHCGGCGVSCAVTNGFRACASGTCGEEIAACDVGFADCNGDAADGCETNVGSDPAHCGGCGLACDTLPHAMSTCSASVCVLSGCAAGYGDCNSAPGDGCETPLDTTSSCGACGAACMPENGVGSCEAGRCLIASCDPGFADCDADPANGCEADLMDVTSCGACGNVCTHPNGTSECTPDGCALASCDAGYGDCDENPTNGCETSLETSLDCGGCGVECAREHAVTSCAGGTCTMDACSPGYADCDGETSTGCERSITTTSDCGACDAACAPANAASSVCTASGDCVIVSCDDTHGDCDGDVTNGCETPLRTLTDCGGCGVACSLPNATATCSSGSCEIASCDADHEDCRPTPGCEPLTSLTDCDGCGIVCSVNHATADCSTRTCVLTCDPTHVDCNGDTTDGCEGRVAIDVSTGPVATHTCAVGADGTLFCWGFNDRGQLGTGDTMNRTSPAITLYRGWDRVVAGRHHTCGLRSGSLYCWGLNASGEVGLGVSTISELLPRRVGTETDWSDVTAGEAHSCGIRSGELYCWGANESGQLGLGIPIPDYAIDHFEPERVGTRTDWSMVRTGQYFTCAVTTGGELWCWGRNLSNSLWTGPDAPSPVQVGTDTDWTSLGVGRYHICAIKSDGRLFCWGDNARGQLGLGTTTSSYDTPQLVGSATDWSEVRGGLFHTCGLRGLSSAAELYCWGNNLRYQLGLGDTSERRSPTRVGMGDWLAVGSNALHTCGISDTGAVHCWGDNSQGQVGTGGPGQQPTPAPICF